MSGHLLTRVVPPERYYCRDRSVDDRPQTGDARPRCVSVLGSLTRPCPVSASCAIVMRLRIRNNAKAASGINSRVALDGSGVARVMRTGVVPSDSYRWNSYSDENVLLPKQTRLSSSEHDIDCVYVNVNGTPNVMGSGLKGIRRFLGSAR